MDIIHSKPHMHIGKFNIINNTSLTVVYSMHKKKNRVTKKKDQIYKIEIDTSLVLQSPSLTG